MVLDTIWPAPVAKISIYDFLIPFGVCFLVFCWISVRLLEQFRLGFVIFKIYFSSNRIF